jgi:hypothetical protein
MTDMAGEITTAVLVGQSTGGYGTYGNMEQQFTLPNSRFVVHFGHTKFACAGRPFREGVGFFPDYWLDTEEPVKAIADYLDSG